jgi:hypothetical protein
MNTHLNYVIAQQRTAELLRSAEHARLAAVGADQRGSRVRGVVSRVGAHVARLGSRFAPSRVRGGAHASLLASSRRSTPQP